MSYSEEMQTKMRRNAERSAKAYATVKEKGRQAYLSGKRLSDCPYPDTRKWNGRLTWSRHWMKLWTEGFEEAKKTAEELLAKAAAVLGPVSPGPTVEAREMLRPIKTDARARHAFEGSEVKVIQWPEL